MMGAMRGGYHRESRPRLGRFLPLASKSGKFSQNCHAFLARLYDDGNNAWPG